MLLQSCEGGQWYKGGEIRKVATEDRELPLVMLFRPSHASCSRTLRAILTHNLTP
jgi:hypothetical protein